MGPGKWGKRPTPLKLKKFIHVKEYFLKSHFEVGSTYKKLCIFNTYNLMALSSTNLKKPSPQESPERNRLASTLDLVQGSAQATENNSSTFVQWGAADGCRWERNAMPCGATQDGRVMVESLDKIWSTGDGKGKPLQYSCLENPTNCMKRQKDMTLKDELSGQ